MSRAILVSMSSKRDDAIQQADRIIAKARYSAEDKLTLQAMFETIFDRLHSLQREPDAWEEAHLVQALGYMESGMCDRAQTELESCLLPTAQRPSWRETQIKKNPRRYTAARLRLRFEGFKAAMKVR
ncbi:MAG: hypothetical protein EBY17_29935 [Acidobacteriia bacterium]|jgi:hypothetical protein|nr:hypothetical protein [Terriglobia bacterium]